SLVDDAAAEPPGEGRADLGIAEIELCRFERGLIDGERRLGLVQGACVLVECIPRHPPILDQDRVAAVVRSRILERSLISLYLSLRLVEGRLVVARNDASPAPARPAATNNAARILLMIALPI